MQFIPRQSHRTEVRHDRPDREFHESPQRRHQRRDHHRVVQRGDERRVAHDNDIHPERTGRNGRDGTVTYNASNHMATFTPTSALTSGTIYTATIMTGARDMAGNPLATNYVWSFTTAAVSGTQTPPRRS